MYFDPASELFLPQGVRLASRRQVAAAWVLGLVLFSITLGIGYITWSLFVWRQGRSPAQRILSLRCWLPESRQVAGREETALRQITGFCLNGQLLSGFFIWLTSKTLRSVGDLLAGTVILHDPDGILGLSPAPLGSIGWLPEAERRPLVVDALGEQPVRLELGFVRAAAGCSDPLDRGRDVIDAVGQLYLGRAALRWQDAQWGLGLVGAPRAGVAGGERHLQHGLVKLHGAVRIPR
jgi:hypothetical protein